MIKEPFKYIQSHDIELYLENKLWNFRENNVLFHYELIFQLPIWWASMLFEIQNSQHCRWQDLIIIKIPKCVFQNVCFKMCVSKFPAVPLTRFNHHQNSKTVFVSGLLQVGKWNFKICQRPQIHVTQKLHILTYSLMFV